jgi:hypothetical protein
VCRFTLPVAEQDWAAYCLGTGQDPRVPPAALASNTRAVDLIADWWTRANRDALKSREDLMRKRRQVERWLADRPAEHLLKLDTYATLRTDCAKRRAPQAADRLIASILRPVVVWALDLDLLTGKSPFSRNKVRVAQSGKRKRVIDEHEEERIRQVLEADTRPDAARLLTFLTAMTATGCRPVELALLQVGDVDYTSADLSERELAGLHRLTVAAAAQANAGEPLSVNAIMDAAYAGRHEGTEGFAYDANGRKTDAAFHAELLGDDIAPWDIDGDAIADMTDAELKAHLARRDRLMDGLKD